MPKDFFGGISSVFKNKDMVQIDYVVDEDRIIGRDEELESLAQSLYPATNGSKPSNCLVYGKPGTGKSLSVKFITQKLKEKAGENGYSVGIAYVDCSQSSSETDAVIRIAKQLNDPDLSDVRIPDTGLSTGQFYQRAWKAMDATHDISLIILDEIDKHHAYDDLLMTLSRAGEANKLTDSSLGVIGISNKPRFTDKLNERTVSSLGERRHVFPPYTANELKEILEARKDAFYDGVLEEGITARVAALSAREYGDARKAMDIFRYAGEIANENQSETVKDEFIDEAFERAERDEILEIISTLPHHSTLVIQSVAALAADRDTEKNPITTTEAYNLYQRKCSIEEASPLSERRVRDLLEEAEFLEIITRNTKAAGKAKGSRTIITLVDDPEKTLEACKLVEPND
ncbi:Cdc6/Cdc18 family protein [Natrinema pallidum]|uniref:ORC1-type DNA replication protein n=1 Tax=Natrinema pallidum DSM 3751 TaxID=1227495 RepID=L9YU74_9EURY|nr:orc1/cdc6 family replication initiation protein [Natrinema pallidum]ELY77007.1 orc1/cdc6 family replication initiation protein [Natrinema pallidum DSM 3751]